MNLELYLMIITALLWLSSIFWDDEAGGSGEERLGRYMSWLFQKLFVQPLKIGWRQSKIFWQRSVLRIRPKELVRLASELGLKVERFRFSSVELAGIRGSLAAELSCWIGRSVTARIENPNIPTALWVTQRRILEGLRLQTGDTIFDSDVAVGGDDCTALALLDQHTRSQLKELVALGGEVGDSGVKISKAGLGKGALELIREGSEALDLAVEITLLLSIEGPQVPGRLAKNAEMDPLPGVRRQNLLALGRHFPLHPVSVRQHRACLQDAAAEVRFCAAEFLISLPGAEPETAGEAAQVLAALARNAELPEDLRASAIWQLGEHPENADSVRAIAEPLIEEVLTERKDYRLVTFAVRCLAALELRNLIPRLEELTKAAEYPVAIAIAEAFGALGGPRAQPVLLQLLERNVPQISLKAAKALGEVGDSQAVAPLLELSHSAGKQPLGQTALEAARRIQGRLVGAEAGQLSLAASAKLEGALSAYEVAAGPGDLSLAEAAPPAPAAPRRVAEGS